MIAVTDGVAVLEQSGFEAVATDLPGEWATDGEWTVAIQTRPVHGGPVEELCHRVCVYEGPAGDVDLETALAAEATATSLATATRRALGRAGYPVANGAGQ